MGAAGGETVSVTENRVCEQAPYMSRTGFEQACSEKGFYEQASNSGANPAKLVTVTFYRNGDLSQKYRIKKLIKMYKM